MIRVRCNGRFPVHERVLPTLRLSEAHDARLAPQHRAARAGPGASRG